MSDPIEEMNLREIVKFVTENSENGSVPANTAFSAYRRLMEISYDDYLISLGDRYAADTLAKELYSSLQKSHSSEALNALNEVISAHNEYLKKFGRGTIIWNIEETKRRDQNINTKELVFDFENLAKKASAIWEMEQEANREFDNQDMGRVSEVNKLVEIAIEEILKCKNFDYIYSDKWQDAYKRYVELKTAIFEEVNKIASDNLHSFALVLVIDMLVAADAIEDARGALDYVSVDLIKRMILAKHPLLKNV